MVEIWLTDLFTNYAYLIMYQTHPRISLYFFTQAPILQARLTWSPKMTLRQTNMNAKEIIMVAKEMNMVSEGKISMVAEEINLGSEGKIKMVPK